MKAFKGFNKDMTCRPDGKVFRYEEGKTYEESTAKACESGFHACEFPLDCFNYYNPVESVYHEVELDGQIDRDVNDSKVAASKITIGASIGIKGIVKASINFVLECVKGAATTGLRAYAATTGDWAHAATTGNEAYAATTGDWAHAATTGNEAHAATTGLRAHAATTGNEAHAATTGNEANAEVKGKHSIAAALGIESKARGELGCWIVLAEWKKTDDGYGLVCVKTAPVDGEKINPGVWYGLVGGEFVELEESDE